MEHRYHTRINTDLKVTLYHQRIPVIITKAFNISKGGLFVASRAMIYPKNTLLDAELRLPTQAGEQLFTLRSFVVYGNDRGMGLMFLDSKTQLGAALKQLSLGVTGAKSDARINILRHAIPA